MTAFFHRSSEASFPLGLHDPSHAHHVAQGEARSPTHRAVSRLPAAAALLAADAVALAVIGAALLALGAGEPAAARPLALAALGVIALGWVNGLYPAYGRHEHAVLRLLALGAATAGGVTAAASLALLADMRAAALALVLTIAALPLQLLLRGVAMAALRRAGLWGQGVAVIGDADGAEAVADFLRRNWRIGWRPEATQRPADVPAIALIAGPAPSEDELPRLCGRFSEIILLAGLPGASASGLRTAALGGALGLRLDVGRAHPVERAVTRVLDIVVASAALALLAPVIGAAALALYVVDPGPVFYRQARIGAGGAPFGILKLRTMYRDAEDRLAALLAADPALRAEWETHFKLRHDPRILPGAGPIIRAASVDELPQLVHVLTGEMSLVGPRPFPSYHIDAMSPGFRRKRSSVPPGITGFWQISARSEADVRRAEELDGFYIDNRSFWLDLHILVSTPAALCRGTGAY